MPENCVDGAHDDNDLLHAVHDLPFQGQNSGSPAARRTAQRPPVGRCDAPLRRARGPATRPRLTMRSSPRPHDLLRLHELLQPRGDTSCNKGCNWASGVVATSPATRLRRTRRLRDDRRDLRQHRLLQRGRSRPAAPNRAVQPRVHRQPRLRLRVGAPPRQLLFVRHQHAVHLGLLLVRRAPRPRRRSTTTTTTSVSPSRRGAASTARQPPPPATPSGRRAPPATSVAAGAARSCATEERDRVDT